MALPLLLPILTTLSNLVRLPALLTFIAALFASLLGFLAQWFTKRVAMQLTIIASVVTITLAILVTLKASLAGITVITPGYIVDGFNMIIPSNFLSCMSLIFSAKITRWVWVWKVHFIELAAGSK